MSNKHLQDYTQYSKYASYLPENERRERWVEQVSRVMDMHRSKLGPELSESLSDELDFVQKSMNKRMVLGSQRALQFGGPPILDHMAKLYNCTAGYVDRIEFFNECMYLLLCGCGVGFSVQKHHVAKLPPVHMLKDRTIKFVIPDSIEGWADAIGALIHSYMGEDFTSQDGEVLKTAGASVDFDFSLIRPEGAAISWGGKAPGPKGLMNAIINITKVFEHKITSIQAKSALGDKPSEEDWKLRPIEAYDIVMHASDAVLSGGIRRSATICLFSPDDMEMATAKTGDWFLKNPQRGRSNNSALLIRGETTKAEFQNLMTSVKEFGEPGFVWADDTELLVNPCVEIGLRGYDEDGNSGFEFCNLCEINGLKATDEETFLEQCRAAAILGTIQASYDSFKYLGKATERIVKREALLGVSITGMMDNPDVLFDAAIQRKGAKLILKLNEEISKKIGINPCARATCVKPAGTTSCMLGTASGIHPHHAKRYFRRVQANKLEFPVQEFARNNPSAVEESVWSNNNTDLVITFLCEVPDGAKTKNKVGALDLLEHVKLTQQNWVEAGTRKGQSVTEDLRHNVSNTINVKPEEWDDVEDYIFKNRKNFAGISLIPAAGDKDYPQAPFCSVYTPKEILKCYGEGTPLASGLIVDGMKAFKGNLWSACDCVLGIGEKLEEMEEPREPLMPHKNGYTNAQWASKLATYSTDLFLYQENKDKFEILMAKSEWVRRVSKFAENYLDGDVRKCTYLLKDVHNWKIWMDLKREYVDIDWATVKETEAYEVDVSAMAGAACSGGACEIADAGFTQDKPKAS